MVTFSLPATPFVPWAQVELGDDVALRLRWGEGGGAHVLPLFLPGGMLSLQVKGRLELGGRVGKTPRLRRFEFEVQGLKSPAEFAVTQHSARADTFFSELERALTVFADGVLAQLRALVEKLVPPPFAPDLRPALRTALRQAGSRIREQLLSPLPDLRLAVREVAEHLVDVGHFVAESARFLHLLLADPVTFFKAVAAKYVADLSRYGAALRDLLVTYATHWRDAFSELLQGVWDLLVLGPARAWKDIEELLDALWKGCSSAMAGFSRQLADTLAKASATASAQLDVLASGLVWLWKRIGQGAGAAWRALANLVVETTAKVLEQPEMLRAFCERVLKKMCGKVVATVAQFGEFLADLRDLRVVMIVCDLVARGEAELRKLLKDAAGLLSDLFAALEVLLDGMATFASTSLATVHGAFEGLTALPGALTQASQDLAEFVKRLQGGFAQVATMVILDAKQVVERGVDGSPLLRGLGGIVQALLGLIERITGFAPATGERLTREAAARLEAECGKLHEVARELLALLPGAQRGGGAALAGGAGARSAAPVGAVRGVAAGAGGVGDAARQAEAALHGANASQVTIRCRPQQISLAALQGGAVELDESVPGFLRGAGADTIVHLMHNIFGVKELTLLDIQVFSRRAETPSPTTITTAGLPDEPAHTRVPTQLPPLILPPMPGIELAPTVRIAPGARFFPVDPRYASAYGSSLQLAIADVDGDGAVSAWELARARAALGTDDGQFDVDKDGVVTADDLRLITEQARHMVNGVPYTEAAAPLGLLLDWPHGSWLYLGVAPLADEDIGARPVPLGTTYRTGTRVDRTGYGLFAHGQLNLPDLTRGLLNPAAQASAPHGAAGHYPVRFALESRTFVDVFPQTPPLFSPGASAVVVVRGGPAGNDWQARLRTNQLAHGLPIPPPATCGFTLRGMVQLTGTGAYVVAAEGAFKLGLEYTCGTSIIDLLQRLRHVVDVGIDAAGALSDPGKALQAVCTWLHLEECARLGQRMIAPWLAVIGFDPEYEATLMVVERLLSWDDPDFSPGLLSAREVLQGASGPSGIEKLATGWAWRGPDDVEGLEAATSVRRLDEELEGLRGLRERRQALEARRASLARCMAQRDAARAELEALEAQMSGASGFMRHFLNARLTVARQRLYSLNAEATQAASLLPAVDEELAGLPALRELDESIAVRQAQRKRAAAEVAAELKRRGRQGRLHLSCLDQAGAYTHAREWRLRPKLLEDVRRREAAEPDPTARAALAAERARLEQLTPPDPETSRRAGAVQDILARLVQKVSVNPELEALREEEEALHVPHLESLQEVERLQARQKVLAYEHRLTADEVRFLKRLTIFGAGRLRSVEARLEEIERERAALEVELAAARQRLQRLDERLRQLAARRRELEPGARRDDGELLDERFMDAWCGAGRMERVHVWRDLLTEDRLQHYGARLHEALESCVKDLAAGRLNEAWARFQRLLSALEGFDPKTDAAGLGDAPLALVELLQLVVAQALAIKRLGDEIVDPAGSLKKALGLEDQELSLFKSKEWSWSLGKDAPKDAPPSPPADPAPKKEEEDTWDVLRPMREELMKKKAREAAKEKADDAQDDDAGAGKKARKKREGSLPLPAFGDDTLSLLWSLDGGAGAGAGGEGAGEGAAATVSAGLTLEPPKLTFPLGLLVDLRSLVVVSRLILKLARRLLEVCDKAANHFQRRGASSSSLLEATPLLPVWLLIALAEATKELMRDEPNWLEAFLNGCKTTIALKAKVEGQAAAVVGLEARGQVTAQATITLAALLDPVVTILEKAGQDLPRDAARRLLSDRIVPKFEVSVCEELTGSVRVAMFEGLLTVNGTILTGDFMLPDGSPWRRTLEGWLVEAADTVWKYGKAHRNAKPVPALQGLMMILQAADGVLDGSVDPLDVPLPTVVAQPSVSRIMDVLRDPAAPLEELSGQGEALRACLAALDAAGPRPLRTREGLAVVEDSAERQGRSRVSAFFSDSDVIALGDIARAPRAYENATHLLQLDDVRPVSVIWNAFSDDTAALIYAAGERTQGLALGFETHDECRYFAAQRRKAHPGWVPAGAHAGAIWDHAGRWYAWLTTTIGADCAAAKLSVPDASLRPDGGLVLRFEHVERGATAPLEALGYGARQRATSDDLYQRVSLLQEAMFGETHAVQAKLFELAGARA